MHEPADGGSTKNTDGEGTGTGGTQSSIAEMLEGKKSRAGGALHQAGKHSHLSDVDEREARGVKKRKIHKPQQPPPSSQPQPQHSGSNDLLRMFKQSANDVSGVLKEKNSGHTRQLSMGRNAATGVSLVEPDFIDLTLDD